MLLDPRHPFQQVSSSFFLWVTSGEGKLLTAQMGTLELRRQKWSSLKIILAEGTQSPVYPSPLFPTKPRTSSDQELRSVLF